MLRQFLQKFGVIRVTILASIVTIILALIITSIAQSLTHQSDWTLGIILAVLCPLLLATPVYYQVFKLVKKLGETEAELKLLAREDSLTRTYNRRYFTELAEREVERCQNLSQPLALLLLDVDHFKIINDSYSHLVGDQVLVQIGWSIRQIIRDTDLLGRYGGDEFLLLLPNTNRSQALSLAERICTAIARRKFKSDCGLVQITVSIGVANAYASQDSVMMLLRKADKALYQAKNAGRNRVGFLIDSNQPTSLEMAENPDPAPAEIQTKN